MVAPKKKKIVKKVAKKVASFSRPTRTPKSKLTKKPAKKQIKKPVKKPTKKLTKKIAKKPVRKITPLDLKRSKHNPIIEPAPHSSFESKATFNPTALYHDGKVHIIYRAIGDNDISVLGYARSDDGHNVHPNSKDIAYMDKNRPIIKKSGPQISYVSGGGWSGGCEDPRLTLLDDGVYMTYTSFDGWGSVRMAMTSISLKDFISKRWNWKKPVLISPPNEIHKNWVVFPEKVKGKYAILHAISPKIMINYFDSLDELDGETFIHSIHQGSLLWGFRDRLMRGVGPAPIKTKYGWLILYHKMERHDTHRYKLWAMILDAKNPTQILHNSTRPILEPDLWYENEGYKGGVVYSCGAIVKNGELFVYYGGADKVSCVATANLDAFLKELTKSGASKLKIKKNRA